MTRLLVALMALAAMTASAQSSQQGVTVHGSVQADALVPQTDYQIGATNYSDDFMANVYASAGLYSRYVDAGLRFEYLQHPLPGFEPDFKGWGVPNFYVKGKIGGVELTAGDFYEQFGSGFILRTYEERSLGIDNSIRGARLKVNTVEGLRLTALGGVMRRFWDWSTRSQVYGADAEADLTHLIRGLRGSKATWTVGASYVLKHERDEDILVEGSNSKLKLPHLVSAFDLRTQYYRGGLDLRAEFAWKSQDPSADNNYTYARGTAAMLSATYSHKGWSAFLQAKRSDNMSFRSRRSQQLASAMINNMPPFAYQHTYSLASMYPYATQAAPGEWAFQGAGAVSFARGSALGGRYGTKLKLNASYICAIGRQQGKPQMGADSYHTGGQGFGETYYTDINLQLDKRLSKPLTLQAMYMFQKYNKTAVEGHGGMVNANIFVVEGRYRFDRRYTLRAELQYLQTRDDQRDWSYGLVELSVLPYLMFTVSDQWNHGGSGIHYYMGTVTANYKSNRLMVGYGRTRAGFNCSGGVCRYVPASRGFQISYSYNF